MAVILTYQQFSDSVPKDTLSFVNQILPYLNYYISGNRNVKYNGDYSTYNNHAKALVIMLEYLHNSEETKAALLSSYNYNKKRAALVSDPLVKVPIDYTESFNSLSHYFCISNDIKDYQVLTPSQIVMNCKNTYTSDHYSGDVPRLFADSRNSYDSYFTALQKTLTAEQEAMKQTIGKQVYGSLEIDTINYLATVSKVHKILSKNRNKELLVNDEYVESIARLIALYHYNAVEVAGEITEKTAMTEIFASKGITINGINNQIGVSVNKSDVDRESEDVLVLSQYYKKYIRAGVAKDKKDGEIAVRDMIKNLFIREFNGTLAIEKIFATANCYVGMFDDFDQQIDYMIEEQKKVRVSKSINEFYAELPKQSKDFMNFTAKCYTLILSEMTKKKHNDKILSVETDADTLALLLSGMYYNSVMKRFFADYGITEDKILKLLGLDISKADVEATKLDEQVLVKKYKRYVYEGVNKGKSQSSIGMNDIVRNLCNRTFNESMIVENIFAELAKSDVLESNFLARLENHLVQRENVRKRELTQKLFKSMPTASMEYLENVSRIHNFLVSKGKNFSDADIRTLSAILGISFVPNDNVSGLLRDIKLDASSVLRFCDINVRNNNELIQMPIDIDLLSKQYGEFIFGGANKGKDRKELTLRNISTNIFDKDINDSVVISRLLATAGLNYEYFDNMDEHYAAYVGKTKKQTVEREKNELLRGYTENASAYVNSVAILHKRLLATMKAGKCNPQIVKDIVDIEELSMLLGLYLRSNNTLHFLKRNKLELNDILNFIGLDASIMQNLQGEEPDAELIVNNYKKYLIYNSYGHTVEVDHIAKKVFDSNINASLVIEQLTSHFGSVYEVLKEEVDTGQEYVAVLTQDERLSIIRELSIPEVDLSSTKDILGLGNALSEHSQYIYSELPRLAQSDSQMKSVSTINDIISRMYVVESDDTEHMTEKQKRKLEKRKKQEEKAELMKLSWSERRIEKQRRREAGPVEPKLVLNGEAVRELIDAVNSNIDVLKQEILAYDFIREYIELYRRKNRLHYIKSLEVQRDLTEMLASININDDEQYFEYLKVSGNIAVLNDKINRFDTSNSLAKQELTKVTQSFVNHSITLNTLEMAKNDLLPMIGSGIAIMKGNQSQSAALDVSNTVIELFKAILNRNINGTMENLARLRSAAADTSLLETGIRSHFVAMQGITNIASGVETLDIDNGYTPVLSLTPSGEDTDTSYKVKEKTIIH